MSHPDAEPAEPACENVPLVTTAEPHKNETIRDMAAAPGDAPIRSVSRDSNSRCARGKSAFRSWEAPGCKPVGKEEVVENNYGSHASAPPVTIAPASAPMTSSLPFAQPTDFCNPYSVSMMGGMAPGLHSNNMGLVKMGRDPHHFISPSPGVFVGGAVSGISGNAYRIADMQAGYRLGYEAGFLAGESQHSVTA